MLSYAPDCEPVEVRIKELRAQVSSWEWWLSGNQAGGSSNFDKIKLNQQVESTESTESTDQQTINGLGSDCHSYSGPRTRSPASEGPVTVALFWTWLEHRSGSTGAMNSNSYSSYNSCDKGRLRSLILRLGVRGF